MITRVSRIGLACVLALLMLPAGAYADDAAVNSLADAISQYNYELYEEWQSKGEVGKLADYNAYNYPENVDGGGLVPLTCFPEKYDLRDEGYVTPVKSQSPWGTCWAFGATSASETSILYELEIPYDETTNDFDLSELHLAWMGETPLSDGSPQDGEGTVAFVQTSAGILNNGGCEYTNASIYSCGVGPFPESDVPYQDSEGTKSVDGDWSVDQSLRFGQVAPLEETCQLPVPAAIIDRATGAVSLNQEGINAMKDQLYQGKGVEIGYSADGGSEGEHSKGEPWYINPKTWAHYSYPLLIEDPSAENEYVAPASNHAVAVVGWDDTYSRDNFLADHKPDGDGAWIVKNSWSTNWGDEGFFYLSYYDTSINTAVTFDYNVQAIDGPADYSFVDQYDYMPITGILPITPGGSVSMANVFESYEEPVELKAVSSETAAPGSTVRYQVYLLNEEAEDPADGTLALQFDKSYIYGGYHRETLPAPVAINAGQDYSVVITVNSQGKDQLMMRCEPGERFNREHNVWTAYSVGKVNEGESFACSNGVWDDMVNIIADAKEKDKAKTNLDYAPYEYDNFPIKAYSDPVLVLVPDLLNLTEAEALNVLATQGLTGVAGKAEYSDTVEKGKVIRQDVAAGTEVEYGATITYVLSLGKEGSEMAKTSDSATNAAKALLIIALLGALACAVACRRRLKA